MSIIELTKLERRWSMTYPLAINLPSGEASTASTQDEWPVNEATTPTLEFETETVEFLMSYMTIRLSSDAENRSCQSHGFPLESKAFNLELKKGRRT